MQCEVYSQFCEGKFHKIFKIICGHKSETMRYVGLKPKGTTNTKFRQNPRGDPKFLVDLTWNCAVIGPY